MFITISCNENSELGLNETIEILKNYCRKLNLKRIDHLDETLEMSFLVEFEDINSLAECKTKLLKADKCVGITLIEDSDLLL